jgi:hypothetical protein
VRCRAEKPRSQKPLTAAVAERMKIPSAIQNDRSSRARKPCGAFGTLADARVKSFVDHDLRGQNVNVSTAPLSVRTVEQDHGHENSER